jgi:DNA-binding transcriptional LysR family regulator
MMNLRHIEIFHAVYVNGSVSAAARALNISQPSVSKTLRHAELLLGFELFQRAGGAAQCSVRFLKIRPGVRFDLQTVHHDDLLGRLYERETDIAIADETPRGAPLGKHWLGEGELVVLYREEDLPNAPLRLELAQLADHPFITLAASGPIGRIFSEELERQGVELNEVASARTFYIAAALVSAGVGLTVVDSFTAEACMAPGLAMRSLKPPIAFDLHAIHLLDRPPSALASEFLAVLGDEIEGR